MKNDLYTLIERLGNLLRSESRLQGLEIGLQPVQYDALYYLSISNRYSDNPLAVAEYLGLTKGTVSQTLKVLESKGLVQKVKDSEDKRLVHLRLTQEGRKHIQSAVPPKGFSEAASALLDTKSESLEKTLSELLFHYQQVSGRSGFGVCKYCRYNQTDHKTFHCGLTNDRLSVKDVELICREFEAVK